MPGGSAHAIAFPLIDRLIATGRTCAGTSGLHYTTNAIESLNMSLRKVAKNRGSFRNDEAMFNVLYLALNNIAKKWTMPIRDWKSALNQFSILFEERMPHH